MVCAFLGRGHVRGAGGCSARRARCGLSHKERPMNSRIIAVITLLAATSTIDVLAHRVIGRGNALHTALVQSPTASPADLPIPIFDTGLSVICIRVTNTSTDGAVVTAVGLELPG